MVFIRNKKTDLIETSYKICENTLIYYPKPKDGEELFTNPKEVDELNYTPKNILKNSFEEYYNEETKISLIIFSIGQKLYIRPEYSVFYPYFFAKTEIQLRKMGLKPKEMNTPFSHGAIPANMNWIERYRRHKDYAKQIYESIIIEDIDEEFPSELDFWK